jgi:hypothetical protein
MLLNPLVWLMFHFGSLSFGAGQALAAHYFFPLALLNSLIYLAATAPSFKQKKLAAYGQPHMANVDALREVWGAKFQADVSWLENGTKQTRTIAVASDDYHRLRVGDQELILTGSDDLSIEFYRFCRFHVL